MTLTIEEQEERAAHKKNIRRLREVRLRRPLFWKSCACCGIKVRWEDIWQRSQKIWIPAKSIHEPQYPTISRHYLCLECAPTFKAACVFFFQ